MLSSLTQIFEHQRDKAGEQGIKIKQHVRTRLEGWDFVDLATDCDPQPRVAILGALGYGWVDFIRSIGAITLLACRFGEIIEPDPKAFTGMCPKWSTLPPYKYYLAVSGVDLKTITKRFGTTRTTPEQPVHGLVWHCPGDILATCQGQCQLHGVTKVVNKFWKPHNDPVQVFYPAKMYEYLRHGGPEKVYTDGAVVFGHNLSWKYRWRPDAQADIEEYDHAVDEEEITTTTPSFAYDSSSEPSIKASASSHVGSISATGGGGGLFTSDSSLIESNSTSPGPSSSTRTDDGSHSTLDAPPYESSLRPTAKRPL